MPVILDLCSGLGGASEAFTHEEWTVIRIEINPELEYVPHTRILDVLEWTDWIEDIPRCDVIWASPPTAQSSARRIGGRTGIISSPICRLSKPVLT